MPPGVEMWIFTSYNLQHNTTQPTLQPTETITAFNLNYGGAQALIVRQIGDNYRHPERVRPPRGVMMRG